MVLAILGVRAASKTRGMHWHERQGRWGHKDAAWPPIGATAAPGSHFLLGLPRGWKEGASGPSNLGRGRGKGRAGLWPWLPSGSAKERKGGRGAGPWEE